MPTATLELEQVTPNVFTTTKLGLQPRSFVLVNTLGVTCSISMVQGMRVSV